MSVGERPGVVAREGAPAALGEAPLLAARRLRRPGGGDGRLRRDGDVERRVQPGAERDHAGDLLRPPVGERLGEVGAAAVADQRDLAARPLVDVRELGVEPAEGAVGAVDVEDHPGAVRARSRSARASLPARRATCPRPGSRASAARASRRRAGRRPRGTPGPRAGAPARPASAPRRAGGPTSAVARRADRRGRRGRARCRRGSGSRGAGYPGRRTGIGCAACPWTSPPPSARPRCATTCSPSWTRTCIRPRRPTSARSRRAATRTGSRPWSRSSRPRRASAACGTCSCPTSAGAPG